mgnify:FL=1
MLLAALLFLTVSLQAQTITPATGGTAISADNFGTGTWTNLTGPLYGEASSGNVQNGTIILDVPSGFIFDVGGTAPTVLVTRLTGSGANSRNINDVADGTSVAITSISTTQITFTVTDFTTSGVTNSLTWQNVRVRPTAGAPLATGNITISGTSTMTGVTNGVTNFGTLTEVAGAINKLVITFPGQTFTSGSGNSGTVTAQTAGTSFNISSITGTDQYLNLVSSYSGAKTIAYAGPGGSASTYTTSVSFTSGVSTTTLATTLTKAEATTITATDGGLYGNVSSSLTVNAGAFTKMQLLVPGETADAGSSTGKTGTPSAQTAGTGFTATVNAVDANWNLVSSTNTIGITTSDANDTHPANAALVAGTVNFTVTFTTAGSSTVTATNVTDGSKTANTSPSITVNAGAFTKMQVLVPGETAAPGTASGKTGTPSNQASGSPFTVTVNAVDANWNLVSSTNTIAITTSDANDTHPANAALVAGTVNFTVTFTTAGSSTVTVTNVTDGSKTANTSPSVTVNAGAFTKLQILVPGETASPGTGSGKTGTPSTQTAGILFNVTVNAVDANWNLVNTVTDVVGLTSSDGSATLSGNAALSAGTGTRNVTFSTSGSFTVTATDITDGGKTPNTSPSITADPAGTGTLTPATGGSTISADNVGGSYTSLTGPLYSEGQNGNITAGSLILNPPSGFIFDVGGTAPTLLITRTAGSGADSRNINSVTSGTAIAAVSVTTTAIEFTITSASNNLVTNSITWQNVRVRPTAGAPLSSGNLTKSGTAPIAGVTNGVTNFGTLTEVAGAINKLVITFPGQTFTSGSGNSGTVTAQTAGTSFNISSITGTDQYLNLVSSYSGAKTIAYAGPGGSASTYTTSVSFTSGVSTTTLATTLTKAEATTITATDGGLYGNVSSSLTVNAGAFTKMQLLVPGETADAGSSTGKTGTPSAQTAGTGFTATVNAVDANWNLVSSTNTIGITTSDANDTHPANAALVAGTVNFTVTFTTAGSSTVTATNVTDGSKTANTSPSITVNAGAFTKMQVLVPGETAAPGTASGKTGTPSNQASGSPFTVTVNAVDANWNLVSSTNTVGITSSDGGATLPANAALVTGTKDFTVTLNTAGTQTVTATNITDGSKTANTSPSITVSAVTITPATGGSAISADNFGIGTYTSLTGPTYGEAISGDAGVGTFILNVPSGFIFDVGGTAPTVLVTRLTGSGANSRNINGVGTGTSVAITSISTTQITFTITSASNTEVTNSLTWQNVRVRPTAGTPLASANLTKTGTSTMTGITNSVTNFGTVTETFGAHNKLVVTLPGQTFTAGSGNSGTPTDQTENVAFNISSITATDQYFNIVTSYATPPSISYSGPTGTPSYTTSVSFTNGVSTTTLATTLTAIENTTITANDGSISGPASSSVSVNGATKIWDGGAATNNWGDGANWNPDNVPTSANSVNLSGANTINVNVAATTKNLTISNASLLLTILTGNAITVSGNYSQSNGTVNIETTFPTVSGTVSITGGTVAYTKSSGSQNVSGQTYKHVTISGGGTKLAVGNITISGNLTIDAGNTVNDDGYQIVGNASGTVSMASGSALTLGNAATATAFPTNFVIGNISLNVASTVTYNSDQPQNIDVLNFGNLTSSGAGSRTFPASQTVGIAGTFTKGTNSYITTSSTINYNGAGTQTIIAFDYNNLTSSSSGARTLASSGTIGIAGTFTHGSNSYTNTGSTIHFNGSSSQTIPAFNYNNLTSSSTGTRTLASSGTIGVAAAFTKGTNSYTTTSSTIDYNGTGSQNVTDFTYNNLTVSGIGTTTLLANTAVNGNLTLSGTTSLSDGGFQIVGNAGGTMTMAAGTTLTLGTVATATVFPTVYITGNISLDAASTVIYNSDAAQTISGVPAYGNLTLSATAAVTKTLGAATTINGNLTINANNTLADGGFQIVGNAAGTLTMAAGTTLTLGSAGTATLFPTLFINANISLTAGSTVIYNSDAAQTISGTPTYRNLTLNATAAVTKTLGAATTINGNLTINANNTLADGGFQIVGNAAGTLTMAAGTTLTLGSAGTATLFPTLFINANISLTAGSTVIYNSDQAQTISATPTYRNLTLNATAAVTKTLGAAITVNGNLAINANNTLNDGGFQIAGNAGGTMTMAAGTSLALGTIATATSFPTSFITANITLNATSTVVYNSDLAQTISITPTYGNLTLTATASVTKSIGGTTTVAGSCTVGANNILSISGVGIVNITGDFNVGGTILNSGTINIGI